MRRITSWIALFILITASSFASPCTTTLLSGTYGYLRIGQTSTGPLTALGAITFDGSGSSTGHQMIDRNGTFSENPPGKSNYTVNPDCSGTVLSPSAPPIPIVVIHNGSEALGMSPNAGNNVAAHFERMFDDPRSGEDGVCSNATLNGVYGLLRSGSAHGQLTTVGTAVFDGQGNITLNESVSMAGVMSDAPDQLLTYNIKADCTGSQANASGEAAQLVVVHDGGQILGLSMVPGTNVALHYERVVDRSSFSARTACRDLGQKIP